MIRYLIYNFMLRSYNAKDFRFHFYLNLSDDWRNLQMPGQLYEILTNRLIGLWILTLRQGLGTLLISQTQWWLLHETSVEWLVETIE